MNKKKRSLNKEKPLIFAHNQQGLIIREYKFKLKVLIAVNEDLNNQTKFSNDSVKTYKDNLSYFLGNSCQKNIISKKLVLKTIQSIKEDNNMIKQQVEKYKQNIVSLNSQLILFQKNFENRMSDDSEKERVEEYLFFLKNSYFEKNNLEIFLQRGIKGFIQNNSDLELEIYHIEPNFVLSLMDYSLKGLRSDLSKNMKNLLKLKSEGDAHKKKIDELEKEIYDIKNGKQIENMNNTYVMESPYLTTEIKSTNNSTAMDKHSERMFLSLLRKKSSSKEDKIKLLISLQNEIHKNLSLIDAINNELEEEDNEYYILEESIVQLNSIIKLKNDLITQYELFLKDIKPHNKKKEN